MEEVGKKCQVASWDSSSRNEEGRQPMARSEVDKNAGTVWGLEEARVVSSECEGLIRYAG